MKLVIDTNLILVSISQKSPFYWIIHKLKDDQFTLCIPSDIFPEYEEVIERQMNSFVSGSFIESPFQNKSVEMHIQYFKWNLFSDIDDNKFVDCALARGADYLVTNDQGFTELKNLEFPIVKVIDIHQFKTLF
jgi:putative PIN family toxin of toxin-antitoxin system